MTASPTLDALLPEAVAEKAEASGVAKAQRDFLTLMTLSLLAGAFIALGAMFSTLTATGIGDALPFGLARLLPALVFSMGLVLVVVCGAELFTGDVLMTIAWASRRLTLRAMLRAWIIVLVGNFIGAVGTALLVYLSDHWLMAEMEVGATAVKVAVAKASLPLGVAFWRGVMCNVLVCLAVWGALAARSVTDKILIVILPVTAFVAAGFEHSVANFYYLALGALASLLSPSEFQALLARQEVATEFLSLRHIVPTQIAVILGNLVGGACLVALTYWLAYLRHRPAGVAGQPAPMTPEQLRAIEPAAERRAKPESAPGQQR